MQRSVLNKSWPSVHFHCINIGKCTNLKKKFKCELVSVRSDHAMTNFLRFFVIGLLLPYAIIILKVETITGHVIVC